jgi:hypothetical protein
MSGAEQPGRLGCLLLLLQRGNDVVHVWLNSGRGNLVEMLEDRHQVA